jgi:hypothetical protein
LRRYDRLVLTTVVIMSFLRAGSEILRLLLEFI